MFMTTHCIWVACDHRALEEVPLIPSRYEMERIANPFGYKDKPWLVIKGTTVGATEQYWRDRTRRMRPTHVNGRDPPEETLEIAFEE